MYDEDFLPCHHRNHAPAKPFELFEANRDLVKNDFTRAQIDTLTEKVASDLHEISKRVSAMNPPAAYNQTQL